MEKMFKFFIAIMNNNGTVKADQYIPKVCIDMTLTKSQIIADFNPMNGIRIHMMPLAMEVIHMGLNVHDVHIIGKAFLVACAHEWRHMQQELLWDEDLPSVAFSAKAQNGIHKDMDAYRRDPGEADARAFADLVAVHAPKNLICALGRLCWILIHRAQRDEK